MEGTAVHNLVFPADLVDFFLAHSAELLDEPLVDIQALESVDEFA